MFEATIAAIKDFNLELSYTPFFPGPLQYSYLQMYTRRFKVDKLWLLNTCKL